MNNLNGKNDQKPKKPFIFVAKQSMGTGRGGVVPFVKVYEVEEELANMQIPYDADGESFLAGCRSMKEVQKEQEKREIYITENEKIPIINQNIIRATNESQEEAYSVTTNFLLFPKKRILFRKRDGRYDKEKSS